MIKSERLEIFRYNLILFLVCYYIKNIILYIVLKNIFYI